MASRRRFIQIDGVLHEVTEDFEFCPDPVAPMIMKDVEAFRSPVDQTMVLGRRTLREHNLRNDVTNSADFTETWKKAEKERKARMDGTFQSKTMRQSLEREFDRRS